MDVGCGQADPLSGRERELELMIGPGHEPQRGLDRKPAQTDVMHDEHVVEWLDSALDVAIHPDPRKTPPVLKLHLHHRSATKTTDLPQTRVARVRSALGDRAEMARHWRVVEHLIG
jgi:hypothetical protein